MVDRLAEETIPRIQRLEWIVEFLKDKAGGSVQLFPVLFTQLASTPPQSLAKSIVFTSGYSAQDDGGGGVIFIWDPTSIATPDGGTVVQVAGIPTGRWIGQSIYGSIATAQFGADPTGATDSTVAIQKAINAFVTANQTAAPFGRSQELRLSSGEFLISNTITLAGCNGGVLRGSGLYQTVFTAAASGLYGLPMFDMVNCQGVELKDVGFTSSVVIGATLMAGAARGTNTLVMSAPIPGLQNNMQIIVAKAGSITFGGLTDYEMATVQAGAGTNTLTLAGNLAGSYGINDFVRFMPYCGVRIREDSTLPGYLSNANYLDNVFAGSNSFPTMLYGVVVSFNTAGVDQANANHVFRDVVTSQCAQAGVLLAGTNSENNQFTNSQFSGAWGIETQNGASFNLVNPAFNDAKGDLLLGAGLQEDKSTIHGGYTEGGGQFIQSSGAQSLNVDVVGFSKKGTAQTTVTNTVTAGTSTLIVNSASFLYPGQTVDVSSFDNTQNETAIIDHISSPTSITLTAGLANTYTKGVHAYAAVVSCRLFDISGVSSKLSMFDCDLSPNIFPGQLWRMQDTNGAITQGTGSVVQAVMCSFGAFGYILDRTQYGDVGCGYQNSNATNATSNSRFVTILNNGQQTLINSHTGLTTDGVGLYGQLIGIQSIQPLAQDGNVTPTALIDLSYPRLPLALVNGVNGDVTDWNQTVADVTGPTAAYSIGGVYALGSRGTTPDGKYRRIYNNTGFTLTVNHLDGTIVGTDQISSVTGQNLIVPSGSYVELWYNYNLFKWIAWASQPNSVISEVPSSLASWQLSYDASTLVAGAITAWGNLGPAANGNLSGTATAHANGGPNNLAYVSANGTTNIMTSGVLGVTVSEIFFVGKYSAGAVGTIMDGPTNSARLFTTGTNVLSFIDSAGTHAGTIAQANRETWALYHIYWTGGANGQQLQIEVNGNIQQSIADTATGFTTQLNFFDLGGAGNPSASNIARWDGFNAPLGGGDRQRLRNYYLSVYNVY